MSGASRTAKRPNSPLKRLGLALGGDVKSMSALGGILDTEYNETRKNPLSCAVVRVSLLLWALFPQASEWVVKAVGVSPQVFMLATQVPRDLYD